MKTIDTNNGRDRTIEFDSFDEYLTQCAKEKNANNGDHAADNEATRSWDMNAGYDGAVELLSLIHI